MSSRLNAGLSLVLSLLCTTSALTAATFTTIDFPGATATFVAGINTQGDMVGYYYDSAGGEHGFLLTNGTFSTIDVPGSKITMLSGINDSGQIVGSYYVSTNIA